MLKQNQAIMRDVKSRNLIKEARWKYEALRSQIGAMTILQRALVVALVVISFLLSYHLCTGSFTSTGTHRLVLIRSVLEEKKDD